jgi:carbonic anhydrase
MDQVKQIAGGQHPFAVVLACADSRVAPEVVFDQGLGELFTIRIAGNSALDDTIGSIEYAIEHLGVRLIVVLGHERCGAVKAAVELAASGGEAAGHLGVLLHAIGPAVDQSKDHASGLRCSNPLCRNTKPHEADAVHCRYCGAKLIEDKDYAATSMVELTVCNHARLQAALLRESTPVLKPRVMSGEIKIVAARYDLDTGEITLL